MASIEFSEQTQPRREHQKSIALDVITALSIGMFIGLCCWLWLDNVEAVATYAALSKAIQCF